MPQRKRLTDEGIKRLRPPTDKSYQDNFDSLCPRLMLTVYKSGKRSWHLQFYRAGKVSTRKLGTFPEMGVKAARDAARKFEENPTGALARAQVGSFGEIAEQFFKRHVEAQGLRSAKDIRRNLDYAIGHLRDRKFLEIGRADYAAMLDKVEDKRGAGQADAVYIAVATMARWFEGRSGDYRSPIVSSMRRDRRKPAERARDRVLNDDEIRQLWGATTGVPIFGDFVRMLLLTAQRRSKVAEMRWDDISGDGTWTIRTQAREKGNPGRLVLPAQALEIIRRQPRLLGVDYIFPGRGGNKPINGYGKRKAALDLMMPATTPWTLHDLRRTARSLLSRAGVRPEVSERVLGHAIAGVEGVYDRHGYADEKADALKRLAALVDNILRAPEADNIIALAQRERAR